VIHLELKVICFVDTDSVAKMMGKEGAGKVGKVRVQGIVWAVGEEGKKSGRKGKAGKGTNPSD